MLAGGGSGHLHGRFSLRQKVKTPTHRLTVARECKSMRNEQSVEICSSPDVGPRYRQSAPRSSRGPELGARGSADRLEASEPAQLQTLLSGFWRMEKEPTGRAPGGSFRNCRFKDRFHRWISTRSVKLRHLRRPLVKRFVTPLDCPSCYSIKFYRQLKAIIRVNSQQRNEHESPPSSQRPAAT